MPQKGQITKRNLNKIAKIYAAGVVYNALGCGGHSKLMSDDQHEYFQQQVTEVAERLGSGLGPGIFQLASLDQIIKYVISERTDNTP